MTEPQTETLKAGSLDDLAPKPVLVPVRRGDGQVVEVALRPLTEAQIWEIRRAVTWPEPPIKDMTKSGPVYDRANPEYVRALQDAERELGARLLLASLPFAVPGETVQEQVAALERTIEQRSYSQLVEASQRINMVSQEEIAALARSFRPG